ncbi:HDOD domain-containing protein [Pelagicoccus mobilis]|uniref:HDOD domain-containing protein n=1 Tax=Pelagicoccus mobilis TaxID=415221 RepID=A0A934RYI1_9BACT|nr:HDOD domain-containing protein [Pelagicoccus mobilis]MBK1877830.1 HDOD domain-containing protein [Pelagicoccus mobilis]
MTTRILIIDEDPKALAAYQEALAPKSSTWTLDCIQSADQGLAAAREHKPDVVIAALSANDGHGAEILTNFEDIAPDAQLFITATEADKPKLESTFGSSFQYLPSPCPANRLISEIQRCVAIDSWLGNDRIKEIVAKMGEFPSVPSIYLKVVNVLNSKESSAEDIANAIAGDLAISAKILQTVNSSYYGYDEKISDISQAVNILGTNCVKNLVLAIQVFNKMGTSPEHRAITDQLWHHSMSVAVAARRISAHENSSNKAAEEAYSAGLMHDIGKLVLLNSVPEQFEEARKLASDQSISLREAEDQIIGCNHAETGAYLLARWGMPANLTEAVALHHEPINSFGKSFSALAAVHIANAIVHQRQNPEHPGATANEEFLADLGKADSWDTWLAVSSGKKPTSKSKSGLSLKSNEPSPNTENAPAAESTEAKEAEAAPAKAASSNATETPYKAPERPKSKTPLVALAACIALAGFGIYALNTIEPQAEQEIINDEPSPQESNLAASIEKAKELSGMNRTEDALNEIFASQEQPSPPEPETKEEPPVTTAEVKTPEPTEELPEPAAPKPLPKPKLPDTKDAFPNIELAGIFYNADRPLASINGKIRKVGDTVSGARIIRIEKSHIVVQHEKTIRSIKLN